MKKLILLLLYIVTCSICACVPTPEEPIIVYKDIERTNNPDIDMTEIINKGLLLNESSTWHEVFSSRDGRIEVSTDVLVRLPSSDIMPIYDAIPRVFEESEIEMILQEIIGSRTLFINQTGTFTKEAAEELILALQYYSEIEDKNYQFEISNLESMYSDLPSNHDILLKPAEIENFYSDYNLVCEYNGNAYSTINIINTANQEDVRFQFVLSTDIVGFSNPYIHDNESGKEQAAIELAENLMRRIGANVYKREEEVYLCNITKNINNYADVPTQQCFEINYTRDVNGLPVTFINKYTGLTETLQMFRSTWTPETITIRTDGESILSFAWVNPVDTVNPTTCRILSFSEIKDIFRKYMMAGDEIEGIIEKIHIYDVRLGYMFIANPNSTAYKLRPVWDFIGYQTLRRNNLLKLDNAIAFSQLTIDAETGAIIHRNLGY